VPITAEAIAAALNGKPSGNGWSAHCVAHEDKKPSLSISEGERGPVFFCHAECSQEAIISALVSRGLWKLNGRDHSDVPLAHPQLGAYSLHWDYFDAAGKHVSRTCRWDRKDGKEIRPLSLQADGWRWKQLESNRPLYRLTDLLRRNVARVLIVEGEKTADAGAKMFSDFVVLTWAGGSKAIAKTDWAPLRGRDVTLLHDNDAPGVSAMDSLSITLRAHGCTLRRVDLSSLGSLPPGWDCADALDDRSFDLDSLWALVDGATPEQAPATPIVGVEIVEAKQQRLRLTHIADIVAEQREPNWLLFEILEAMVLAVIAGARGTFKSFIALHWSMLAALEGRCVILLSAEGAGLDRRVAAWMHTYGQKHDLRHLKVLAIEKQFNLNDAELRAELRAEIKAAGISPDLFVVDTYSKYSPGIKENDNAEVAEFLGALSVGLRDEYGATVLLVAHSGHGNDKRPRGAYVLMANPDAEYIVERPNPTAMTVTVTRDRFKDYQSLEPLAYEARVLDLGRADKYGKQVTSLVLADTGAPPPAKKKALGKVQESTFAALREWVHANPTAPAITSDQLAALLRRHNVSAKRKPEQIKWLVDVGMLTPSVGGHTVNRGAL